MDIIDVEVLNIGTSLAGGKKELHVGKGTLNIREAVRNSNTGTHSLTYSLIYSVTYSLTYTATSVLIPLIYEPKSYKKGFVRMTATIKDAAVNDTSKNAVVATAASEEVKSIAPETSKKAETVIASDTKPAAVDTSKKADATPPSSNAAVKSDNTPANTKPVAAEVSKKAVTDDDDDEELKILPVNGSQKYFITKITAKDLKNVEMFGSNDNFLQLNIGNKWSAETTVLEGSGATASWNYTVEKDKKMTIELSNQEVLTYSPTHLLTYSLTHSLTHSHLLTHSITHSLIN